MNNKRILALMLSLNLLMYSCRVRNQNQRINNISNDTTSYELILNNDVKETNIELLNNDNKSNEDLEDSTITNEENENDESTTIEESKINFAYVNKDTLIKVDDVSLEISKYQKVLILDNESYLVEDFDGNIGFINKEDITLLPDTFTEVDISSQKLYYYVNNELVLSSDVVTGSKRHSTRVGYNQIYQKYKNIYLTGPTWRSFVEYWMAFDGGIGIHDASWRNKFGGEIYIENGSHGCVNSPYETAKELYEKTKIGDYVLVHK